MMIYGRLLKTYFRVFLFFFEYMLFSDFLFFFEYVLFGVLLCRLPEDVDIPEV